MRGQKTIFFLLVTILFVVFGVSSPSAYAQEGPFGDVTCGDLIDNDGDGDKDAADTGCYNYVNDPAEDDDGD